MSWSSISSSLTPSSSDLGIKMPWSSISSSLTSSSPDLGSSSSSAESGVYDIDKVLIEYKDERVTPVKFRHYRGPSTNNVFGIIHHFGELKVRFDGPKFTGKTRIKFEKCKTEGSRPVGKVTVDIFNRIRLGQNDEMVHEVTLPQGCQKILMQELLNLLTTERTLSYSVWRNNCWKYVYDCERAMLEVFAALPNTSPACKESLDEERKNLPKPSLLSDVFRWQKLLAAAFVAAPLSGGLYGGLYCASFLLSLYLGALQLRQGGVVLYKLINFASEAVKLEGVKGLGASLYCVQNMPNILGVHQYMPKILGVQHMHTIQGVYKIPITVTYKILTTVARALGGIFCWKGVAICFAVFMSLAIAGWFLECVANNTTFSRRFNNTRLRRSGSSQCS